MHAANESTKSVSSDQSALVFDTRWVSTAWQALLLTLGWLVCP